jgi:hypothetical protein
MTPIEEDLKLKTVFNQQPLRGSYPGINVFSRINHSGGNISGISFFSGVLFKVYFQR